MSRVTIFVDGKPPGGQEKKIGWSEGGVWFEQILAKKKIPGKGNQRMKTAAGPPPFKFRRYTRQVLSIKETVSEEFWEKGKNRVVGIVKVAKVEGGRH